jgi:glycosyltransferase involved in cell wall biosynthesis
VPSVAFITTCKGRLHHLQQTLPLMAAEKPDELIVVDYSCPDGSGAWVEQEYPQAKVVRTEGKDKFNLCDARNLGAAAATSDWLFFVDADIRLAKGMLGKLRKRLKPGGFYMPEWVRGTPIDIWGSSVSPRLTYEELEGYDEVFEGWGADDEDFYHRMESAGLERRHYPAEWVDPIVHADEERAVVSDSKELNEATNACYGMAKREISRLYGGKGNLPLEARHKLMAEARRLVGEWFEAGARGRKLVRFVVAKAAPHRLSAPITATADTAVTVTLERRIGRKRDEAR